MQFWTMWGNKGLFLWERWEEMEDEIIKEILKTWNESKREVGDGVVEHEVNVGCEIKRNWDVVQPPIFHKWWWDGKMVNEMRNKKQ